MTSAQLYKLAEKKRNEELKFERGIDEQELKKRIEEKVPSSTLKALRKKWQILEDLCCEDFQMITNVTVQVVFKVYDLDENLDYGFDFDDTAVYEKIMEAGDVAVKKSSRYTKIDKLQNVYAESFLDCVNKYKVTKKDLTMYIKESE